MTGLLDLVALVLTLVLADVVFWNQNTPSPISPLTHPTVFDEMYADYAKKFGAAKPKRNHKKKVHADV